MGGSTVVILTRKSTSPKMTAEPRDPVFYAATHVRFLQSKKCGGALLQQETF